MSLVLPVLSRKRQIVAAGATLVPPALVVLPLLICLNAFATGLTPPFSFDSASVLPKGVRNVRLSGFTTQVSTKYDGTGQMVGLGNSFNQTVTWRKLIDSQPASFDRDQLKGGLTSKANGVSLDSIAGYTQGVVDTRITVTVPVLAYGVTDKLTLALAVPVVYSNVNVSTGWTASDSMQSTVDALSGNGYHGKLQEKEEQLQNVVSTRLNAYGYKLPENESSTNIGDVTLAGKYQYFKSRRWTMAVAPRVALPTGRPADLNKIVDVPTSDNSWSVGTTMISEYSPTAKFSIVHSLGYLYQAPKYKMMRIPMSSDESASPDIDLSTRAKFGDVVTTGLSGQYKLLETWTVGLGATAGYKFADQYSGGLYAPVRYNYLSQDTEGYMVSGQVGLTFSTVPWYMTKRFAAPLEGSVNFSQVLAGRNVNNVSLAAFELAAYF